MSVFSACEQFRIEHVSVSGELRQWITTIITNNSNNVDRGLPDISTTTTTTIT